MKRIFTITLATILLAKTAFGAELKPDEVAVIAMAQSEQSCRLADYYVSARGIPKSQVLLLNGKPGTTIGRADWQDDARPAIRRWLDDDGRHTRIRCLVTCWDVPLRIGKRDSGTSAMVARQKFLAESRARLVKQLAELTGTLDTVLPGERPTQRPTPDAGAATVALIARFESAFAAARERLQTAKSDEEKRRATAVFERTFLITGGTAAYLRMAARGGDATKLEPEVAQRLESLKGQLGGLSEGIRALGSLPETVPRDLQMLRLIHRTNGLIGAIQWIDQEQQALQKNETYSSFDSELSLLYWPDYPLSRWLPNTLHYRLAKLSAGGPRTLMVSRLEAPSFELAKGLVDTAIATEKAGLTGKVYLDARGIKFDPANGKRGSYGEYDQSLRDLAERLQEHTELEVVLDDQAKLFGEGDCPQAALYCGWYSLAKYIDAFDWRPGAVGYHMASAEATTLRTPGRKVWCNAMLEDGICATLGPVHEPYLAAFPLPDEFFPLLLTGRYTLVEAYYRTKPHNSWVMVLVGDPLYNPFKNNPPLSEDALPERMRQMQPTGVQ